MTEVKSSRLALGLALCIAGAVLLAFGGIAFCFSVANVGHDLEQKVTQAERRATDTAKKCLEDVRTPLGVEESDRRDLLPQLTSLILVQLEGDSPPLGEHLVAAMQVRYPDIDVSTHKFLLSAVLTCRETVSFADVKQAAENLGAWCAQDVFIERPIRSGFPTAQLATVDRRTGARVTGAVALEALRDVVSLDELVQGLGAASTPVQSVATK